MKGWADWMVNFMANIAPGCEATVHSMSWDEENYTANYFATFKAKHTGDGGPIPATNRATSTEYCYAVQMSKETNKCIKFTKIWNDGYCLSELGWA